MPFLYIDSIGKALKYYTSVFLIGGMVGSGAGFYYGYKAGNDYSKETVRQTVEQIIKDKQAKDITDLF